MAASNKMDLRETNLLVADNNFIKAKYDGRMSLNAMKLLRLAITQCKMTDQELLEYEVNVKDMGKMFQIIPDNIYREADSMTTQMMKTIVTIGDGNPKHPYEKYSIFSKCIYDGNGKFTIKINDDMKPFMLNLKRNFTKIQIGNLVTMKSKYSIRIYELICEQMRNEQIFGDKTKEVELMIQDVRFATNTEKKLKQMSEFKKNLWNVAIDEINNSDIGWFIEYDNIKDGRSIVGFKVKIHSKIGYQFLNGDQIEMSEI